MRKLAGKFIPAITPSLKLGDTLAGPYPEFFDGGVVFPKLDLFFYKCHFIYRYIKDEMLENVILVILRRKIGYAVYALIFYFVSTVQ